MPIKHHSIVTWEQNHVRAAVVELGQGVAELLGVAAAPVHGIDISCHPDIERWVAGVGKALTQAEDMTPETCGRKTVPNHVTMSIPGPVTQTMPVEITFRRRNAAHGVTLGELTALLERGYRKGQDILGTRSREMRTDFISGTVAQISLDDQVVLDPLGLHGQVLTLQMSFSLAPLEWIRALELVADRLKLDLVAMVPDHAICAAPAADNEALLVALYDQASLLSLVRRGRVAWTQMAPQGEREVVQAVVRAVNAAYEESGARHPDGLMRAYRAGSLRTDVENTVINAFWLSLRNWMNALAGEYRAARGDEWAPHHIYFWDVTRRLPEAAASLETPFWERALPFDRAPEVIALETPMIPNVLDRTGQAGDRGNLVLRSLAHYLAGLFGAGNSLDRILASIIATSGRG
jgi:hypothetical protein